MAAVHAGAKGKGKAPPMPPVWRAANGVKGGKGGKGQEGVHTSPPPLRLRAPQGSVLLRIPQALPSSEGTMWEGLDLWGTAGLNVLEGTLIDYEVVQRLWEPMPQPPESLVTAPRANLPSRLDHLPAIATKAAKLTPEVVRRAFMEDMTAASPLQAQVLYMELLPAVREAEPVLAMIERRDGVNNFTQAEAVLWTLANIPSVDVRARVLWEQHCVEESVAHVRRLVDRVLEAEMHLRRSRPLRTVLQTILTVRNILGQRACPGFVASSLSGLHTERLNRHVPATFDPVTLVVNPVDLEWLQQNNPSVLALVAEMLVTTHEYRCRLRFLRMFAVGRSVSEDNLRLRIWSYLDDLQESPWDAVTLLCSWTGDMCSSDTEVEILSQYRKFKGLLDRDIAGLLLSLLNSPHSLFYQQVQNLQIQVASAVERVQDCRDHLSTSAANICHLVGSKAPPSKELEAASQALIALHHMGIRLKCEMERVEAARRAQSAAARHTALRSLGTQAVARRWPRVETRVHQLATTADTDLIRRYRARRGGAPSDETGTTAANAAGEVGVAVGDVSADVAQAIGDDVEEEECDEDLRHVWNSMMHGGPDGRYQRDPVTGRWGQRLDGIDGTAGAEFRLGGPHVDA